MIKVNPSSLQDPRKRFASFFETRMQTHLEPRKKVKLASSPMDERRALVRMVKSCLVLSLITTFEHSNLAVVVVVVVAMQRE